MKTPFLVIAALAATVAVVCAHFNLREPAPYNPIDCNRPDCTGPCPPVWSSGSAKARNSPQHPARVWRRGSTVPIEWHRNNHEGGFYTRSLVPVQHLHDRKWHKKGVFEYGCWVQNIFYCGKQPSCGTDKRGFAYRNKMRVPTVFPDGDYVFAMTWFGGLHWRRRKAHFSDYYTCSFVRIRGGPLTNKHTPTFVAGQHYRSNIPKGKCVSTSSFLGECAGQECKNNPVSTGKPRPFQPGQSPRTLYRSEFQSGALRSRGAKVHAKNMSGEKRALEENKKEQRRDDADAAEEAREKKGKRKIYRAGGFTCGTGRVPPKASGAWGPRNSQLWWRKRAQWWAHHNYCLYCKHDC